MKMWKRMLALCLCLCALLPFAAACAEGDAPEDFMLEHGSREKKMVALLVRLSSQHQHPLRCVLPEDFQRELIDRFSREQLIPDETGARFRMQKHRFHLRSKE